MAKTSFIVGRTVSQSPRVRYNFEDQILDLGCDRYYVRQTGKEQWNPFTWTQMSGYAKRSVPPSVNSRNRAQVQLR